MRQLATAGVVLVMAAGGFAQVVESARDVPDGRNGDGDPADTRLTVDPAANGWGTKPANSLAAMVGFVMKDFPARPARLDANAPTKQRLEWISKMQKWKRAHDAWRKKMDAWKDRKIEWTFGMHGLSRTESKTDPNVSSLLATVRMKPAARKGPAAALDRAELVIACRGEVGERVRKAMDANKPLPGLRVRGTVGKLDVKAVAAEKADLDANAPRPLRALVYRPRFTLKAASVEKAAVDRKTLVAKPFTDPKTLNTNRAGKPVSLFGVKTKATHVIYLSDASGSIAMGGVFDFTCREMVMSISELRPSQRFSLLVSSNKKTRSFPHQDFASAADDGKENAAVFLGKLRPEGQADMLAALKDGLGRAGKEAKADKTSVAIYLVSDGVFTGKKAAAKAVRLIKEARKKNSCIEVHALLLGKRPKKQDPSYKQMKAIAEAGGGKFKIVAPG